MRQAFRRAAQRRPTAPLESVAEARLADAAADPARAALTGERDAALRDAVTHLPERYREVVALRFFADLSLHEIAETTGRPLNTVKTHLRRGLEALRPAVSEATR
jgi:RNA polymerase sigma-70 factor (ECF subfamily)